VLFAIAGMAVDKTTTKTITLPKRLFVRAMFFVLHWLYDAARKVRWKYAREVSKRSHVADAFACGR